VNHDNLADIQRSSDHPSGKFKNNIKFYWCFPPEKVKNTNIKYEDGIRQREKSF